MKYTVTIAIYTEDDKSDWQQIDTFPVNSDSLDGAAGKVKRSKNFKDISLAYPDHRLHVVIA